MTGCVKQMTDIMSHYKEVVLTISGLQVGNNMRVKEIHHIYQLTGLCNSMLHMYTTIKYSYED